MKLYTLPFAFLMCISFAPPHVYALPNSPHALQNREDEWARFFLAGDIKRLAALYSPEAWLVLPGAAPIEGRPAIQASLAEMAGEVADLSLKTISVVKVSRKYFVENGVAHYRTSVKGSSAEVTANYQLVWLCDRHGACHLLRDILSLQ